MSNDQGNCEEGRDLPYPEWVASIKEKLERAGKDSTLSSRKKLSIYRVPQRLREMHERAYAPRLVSIGPYHHANLQLSEMESQKWRILNHVLKRKTQDIKLYLDTMTKLEEARGCYERKISLTKNKFIEMMVLDGIFVLEVLQGGAKIQGYQKLNYSLDDNIFSNSGTIFSILEDMIKLENQLPLLILHQFLQLQLGSEDVKVKVANLISKAFSPLMPTFGTYDGSSNDLHCLDVFRKKLLMGESKKVSHYFDVSRKLKMVVLEKACCCLATDVERGEVVHCATELKNAGVKFKKRKTTSFLDIKFENGILEIPQLQIGDCSKLVFLNLIAFEQCHQHCGSNITSYAFFMDSLINSEQDVAYLHKHKIIEHGLGNDAEVANLFNNLCKEVAFDWDNNYLSNLSDNLNRYSKHKCNAWVASLKDKYFSNPWSIISLLAALVLLVLTVVQTIFAVKDYHKP